MRRLTPSKPRNDGERGAVSVIVALMLVALLAFGAIAVDVGMLYAERTQLRNGADAAALAIAQKCSRDLNDPDCSTSSSLAADLNNGNATDGLSHIKSTVLHKTNRTVTVTVGAQEAGHSPNEVSLFFARVLGMNTAEVTASSSAQWGTPSKGPAILPLAIAYCRMDLTAGSPSGSVQVLEQAVNDCGGIPGGFGWIGNTGTTCAVTVTAGLADNTGIWFPSDTGASAPTVCTAADFSQMNDQTVLLPLYDLATGEGSAGKYYVKGFAAFHVTGYHFADISWTNGAKVANKTIRGYFVRFVSLSEAFELGDAPGTTIVRLTP
ncbi:pilus assembly protein TadG [Pseudarthrobacter sulfonivorans]|uniref:Pilus assembly protein TadG n=1 Tax=Pseudarthrobacter sulfonivorans TaxID=121292 RepID=A0A0U3P0J1_9MICC|nr:pilus assembly protein TadG-related protein [Pseudarthrobacter sulfonivorans]ALV42655.1 pilus assembly protein TadG [Pseudarthrobacter sulfonivorans]